MPRFYFDVRDGETFTRDNGGAYVASIELAREKALATLGDIAHHELPDGGQRNVVIILRDQGGRGVLTAALSLRVERLG